MGRLIKFPRKDTCGLGEEHYAALFPDERETPPFPGGAIVALLIGMALGCWAIVIGLIDLFAGRL
jgi:hypothetical protein